MTRLTERDRQIIGKAYQGQLAESIARDMQISTFTVSTGTLKRLGTSLKNIRAAARTGVKLEKLIIDLEGNGHDSTPPVSDIQSLTLSALASIEKRLASIESKLGVK